MPYFWISCSFFQLEYFAHFWFYGILIYSMISIISTGSIKRTGLVFFPKFLLNVPYDLIFNHVFLNVLVSIKRTGLTKPNIVLVLNKISNQVDEV